MGLTFTRPESLLKGLHTDSPTSGLSSKGTFWKAPRIYVKIIHLLILKHLLESHGPVRIHYGDRGTGGHHFSSLLGLAYAVLFFSSECHLYSQTTDIMFTLSLCLAKARGDIYIYNFFPLLSRCYHYTIITLSFCHTLEYQSRVFTQVWYSTFFF